MTSGRTSVAKRLGTAATVVALAWWAPASAEHTKQRLIVAIGASNTSGHTVSPKKAWPAQLETELAKTCGPVLVINEGLFGDTTDGMKARMAEAVPPDTELVFIQPGGNNFRVNRSLPREEIQKLRQADIQEMAQWLTARGIKVIIMENSVFRTVPPEYRAKDNIHFTRRGHAFLAHWALPQARMKLGC